MLDPAIMVVLDEPTEVFEDGYGRQKATRVACVDYYADNEMPETGEPAYRLHGAHGKVYVPEDAVDIIVNLDDHDFHAGVPGGDDDE